jgi:hypothetical protein
MFMDVVRAAGAPKSPAHLERVARKCKGVERLRFGKGVCASFVTA